MGIDGADTFLIESWERSTGRLGANLSVPLSASRLLLQLPLKRSAVHVQLSDSGRDISVICLQRSMAWLKPRSNAVIVNAGSSLCV